MDASHEPSRSRTQARNFRKRKQLSSLRTDEYSLASADKRQRLYDVESNGNSRRSSKESGEISTSASDGGSVSYEPDEIGEVNDYYQSRRPSAFEFTPLNGDAELHDTDASNEANDDDFDDMNKADHQMHGDNREVGLSISPNPLAIAAENKPPLFPTDPSMYALPEGLADQSKKDNRQLKTGFAEAEAQKTAQSLFPSSVPPIDLQKAIRDGAVVLLTINLGKQRHTMRQIQLALCKTLSKVSGRALAFALVPLWRDVADSREMHLTASGSSAASTVLVYHSSAAASVALRPLEVDYIKAVGHKDISVDVTVLTSSYPFIPDFTSWSAIPRRTIDNVRLMYIKAVLPAGNLPKNPDFLPSKSPAFKDLKGPPITIDERFQYKQEHLLTDDNYGTISEWLQAHDPDLSPQDLPRTHLRDHVKSTKAQDPGLHVAEALLRIDRGAPGYKLARQFLRARYRALRFSNKNSVQTELKLDHAGRAEEFSRVSPISDEEYEPVELPRTSTHEVRLVERGALGQSRASLFDVRDIDSDGLRTRVYKLSHEPPVRSAEEVLRWLVVRKADFNKAACKFLKNVYSSNNVSQQRSHILERDSPLTMSHAQLYIALSVPTGFLRPMDLDDVLATNKHVSLLEALEKLKQSSPQMSWVQGLLELAKDGTFSLPARQILDEYVKVNYVGPGEGTTRPWQDSAVTNNVTNTINRADVHQPKTNSTNDRIRNKVTVKGAASLTLDELDDLIPNPSSFRRAMTAADTPSIPRLRKWMAKAPAGTSLAPVLLNMIKTSEPGEAAMARGYLDRYIDENYIRKDHAPSNASRVSKWDVVPRSTQTQSTRARLPLENNKPGAACSTDGEVHDNFAVSQSKYAKLRRVDLQIMLSDPSRFTRRMNKDDLRSETMSSVVDDILRTKNWSLEQALIYLAQGDVYPLLARKVIIRYIDECYRDTIAAPNGSSLHTPVDAEEPDEVDPSLHSLAQTREAPRDNHEQETTATKDIHPDDTAKPLHQDYTRYDLTDMEMIMSDATRFTRRVNNEDLRSRSVLKIAVDDLCETRFWTMEQALIYLAKGKVHHLAARDTLDRYIDECYHGTAKASNVSAQDLTVHDGEASMMDLGEDYSDDQSHEDSADEDSVDDYPHTNAYDYGAMARAAATSAVPSEYSKDHTIRLFELSDYDQGLQRRYFNITDSQSAVRCLCCGKEGHTEGECASLTCVHCGAFDQHFSDACPAYQKCGRCRQRGHDTATCTSFSGSMLGLSDTCDVCGRSGHVEEECAGLYRTFVPDPAQVVKIPQRAMLKACYSCGASGPYAHWGDDCPKLPPYMRRSKDLNNTWSAEHANQFVSDADVAPTAASHGYGGGQNYQLALLNDMM